MFGLSKEDGSWLVSVIPTGSSSGPNGYQYVKLFWENSFRGGGTKSKAEAKRVAELWLGEHRDKLPAKTTLNQFVKAFFDHDTSECIHRKLGHSKSFQRDTARDRQAMLDAYILPEFGRRPLNMIGSREVSDWLLTLKGVGGKYVQKGKPLSGSRKKQILVTFRIVMADAKDRALIDYNPLADTEQFAAKYRKRDAFTDAELARLFPFESTEKFLAVWHTWMWAAFFCLLYSTGMRLGEARALRYCDFNLKELYVQISRAAKRDGTIGSPKTGKGRIGFLQPEAGLLILRLLLDREQKRHGSLARMMGTSNLVEHTPEKDRFMKRGNYAGTRSDTLVFFTTLNHPLDNRNIRRHFDRAVKAARIETKARYLTPHSFRHTLLIRCESRRSYSRTTTLTKSK